METMENLIGKKVRGFKFKGSNYVSFMDKHIGEIGVIEYFDKTDELFRVQFKDEWWNYPLSEIENHLVEEFKRGELVEVRDDNLEWTPSIFLKAEELIRTGNDKQIAYGRGMLEVIDKIMSIIETDGEQLTDGEMVDEIYELINNK